MGNLAPHAFAWDPGGWWGFQARVLPYLESNNIYKLLEPGFTYNKGSCFDFMNAQPANANPALMVPPCDLCPDDLLIISSKSIYTAPGSASYACGSYFGVSGTGHSTLDGILLHTAYSGAITISKVTDGVAHTLIMGERGVSMNQYGWPYCGARRYDEHRRRRQLILSTNLGLSPGTDQGADDSSLLELSPQLVSIHLCRWYWPRPFLRYRFADVPCAIDPRPREKSSSFRSDGEADLFRAGTAAYNFSGRRSVFACLFT